MRHSWIEETLSAQSDNVSTGSNKGVNKFNTFEMPKLDLMTKAVNSV